MPECSRREIPYDIDIRQVLKNIYDPTSGWTSYLGVVERVWAPDMKMHGLLTYKEIELGTMLMIQYFSNDKDAKLQYVELLDRQVILKVTKHEERLFKDEDFKDYLCDESDISFLTENENKRAMN